MALYGPLWPSVLRRHIVTLSTTYGPHVTLHLTTFQFCDHHAMFLKSLFDHQRSATSDDIVVHAPCTRHALACCRLLQAVFWWVQEKVRVGGV